MAADRRDGSGRTSDAPSGSPCTPPSATAGALGSHSWIFSSASSWMCGAGELAPETPDTWTRRAQVLMELDRYAEATVCIDQYLRLSPEDFDHPDVQAAYDLRAECEAAELEAAFQDKLEALESNG